MILPDVNILIYAFRVDSGDHRRYRDWLEAVVNSPEAYGIAPQVLCSFVRIVTHSRVYAQPSRLKDALLLLEIRLLDHFVVGDGPPVSMASRGML